MPAPLIFWDVDTQYDFMAADGKLYVIGGEMILPLIERLTDHAHEYGIPIVASADDHVPEDPEISDEADFIDTFPPHCMRGTPGQAKIRESKLERAMVIPPEPQDPATLAARVRSHDGDFLLTKHVFDVFSNPNTETVVAALDPRDIVLYGVALDVCDRFAIEGLLARRPGTRIWLVTDATRPIRAAAAPPLLADWKARGVRLVTTEDVLARRAPE